MGTFLHAVASNAVLATVAAIAVWAVARFIRRPEVIYWLWALVLLKLVTPPILALPLGWTMPAESTTVAPSTNAAAGERSVATPQRPQSPLPPLPEAVVSPPSHSSVRDGLSQTPVAAKAADPVVVERTGWIRQRWASVSWSTLIVGIWIVGSALWFALAGIRLCRFRRLIHEAEPAPESLQAVASDLARRFGLARCPEVRVLNRRIPPLVWWAARRATIVLPASLLAQLDEQRQATLVAHELAHYRRGDPLVRWGETLLLGLYWWHPAAWWACRRLHQAEEQCCDAWVLRILEGHEKRYAHTLLSTVEFLAELPPLVPVVASEMDDVGMLRRRLEMILQGQLKRRVSWLGYAVVAAAALVLLPWSAGNSPEQPVKAGAQAATPGDVPMANSAGQAAGNQAITGTVAEPDGSPVAGAEVWLVGGGGANPILSHQLPPVALPIQQRWSLMGVVGKARTDAAGRFAIGSKESAAGDRVLMLIARAEGLGAACQKIETAGSEQKVQLPKSVPIQGQLLTSKGQPAADAEVTVDYFSTALCEISAPRAREENWPEYWPQPVHADKEGRFTLTGMPAGGQVGLVLKEPGRVIERVFVDTGAGETNLSRAFEIKLLPTTFSHTLPSARIVEGTVTAADTGKPLPGISIQVSAMGRHGGMPQFARTDEQGRYRVVSEAKDSYIITAYPSPDSRYAGFYVHRDQWPEGSERMVQDFVLDHGQLVRGQVVDEQSGKPIAGASVTYRLSKENPLRRKDYELRNPTLTDEQGRFTLTALTGAGYLLVETPERIYVRKPIPDRRTRYEPVLALGYTPITVPQEGAVEDVLIKLQRGRTVTLQTVAPDGTPLPSVTALWEGLSVAHDEVWNVSSDFPDGKVIVPELGPEGSRRVVLVNVERQLGGFFDITPQTGDGPIEVRLSPLGTIIGQLVTDSGQPVEKAQANLYFSLDPAVTQFTQEDLWHRSIFYSNFIHDFSQTEPWPEGKIVLKSIVPGIPLGLQGAGDNLSGLVTVAPLQPGERRDVGSLVLTKRR